MELLHLILSSSLNEAIFLLIVLLSATSFLRISIIFGFIKIGLGLEGLAGSLWSFLLSLSLCLLISNPIISEIDKTVLNSSSSNPKEINSAILSSLRDSLLLKVSTEDLSIINSTSSSSADLSSDNKAPLNKLLPAYILSEIKWSFKTGLKLLLPFLVIDLIVAHVFTALGVVTLSSFSLAFTLKVLLLASVGGWDLIVKTIISSS